MITDENRIEQALTRGVSEIIDRENLKQKMLNGAQLRVKLGIDPTSPNIHLGRSIPLLKLKDFQDLGHTVVLIIGDFTGVIGDTSDKESERPMLSEDEVKNNLRSYIEQAGKIINIDTCEIHHNSEWLSKLNFKDISRQADVFSLNDFIGRENISKRLSQGKRISVRELLYPLMQGFDSVAVKADLEVGGTDQRFNLLAGRDLQRLYGDAPQDILTLTLVEGLDGRKMSSSWGNTINLFDSPNDMFGKVMSLRDEMIYKYFELATRVPYSEIEVMQNPIGEGAVPKEWKMTLAKKIVEMYHGRDAANASAEHFTNTFSKGEFPENTEVINCSKGEKLADLLVDKKIIPSKTEFRRLIEAGAVSDYPDKKINDPNEVVGEGERKIKIGKKTFVILKPE